jgi:hypothetical protein
MHVLCGLRGDETLQRLPELRRRFCAAPDQAHAEWRPGVCTTNQAPSDKRVHLKYSLEDVATHCARLREVPPEKR